MCCISHPPEVLVHFDVNSVSKSHIFPEYNKLRKSQISSSESSKLAMGKTLVNPKAKFLSLLGMVAHTCDLSPLGGQGGQDYLRSGV